MSKQFLLWQGKPLWWHSACSLARSPLVRGLVFVFPQGMHEEARASLLELDAEHELGLPWRLADGGAERQDSVRQGLEKVPLECTQVLVHDSARPFVSPELTARVIQGLHRATGVIPGLAVTDTMKLVDEGDRVRTTIPRERLRAVQTPQGFAVAALRQAHARAVREGWSVTDDAALLERCGYDVLVVEGEESNKKITVPEDMALLESPQYSLPCSGFGYDVHRYGGERPLRLGGVPIPGGFTVSAHSDGDVLLHALMDAVLGCLGAGDIGRHFPDSDPKWETISSAVMLSEVLEMARQSNVSLCHVDMTVIAQKPRLEPHAEQIRRNVARLMALPESAVNFKATTEEGLGFTGALEGIKATALVSALKTPAHVGVGYLGGLNGGSR